jgi:Ca2+-transporting ATPase
MGKRGSEVARKAASLVLTNDDLASMVTAVSYGRNIYTNLKKAIQYIISIHIPLISVVTIPLLLGWKFPNIFSPVHVIFLELIMGPTCSIVYENEPIDKSLMNQKPRKMSDSLFTWSELSRSIIQGLAITIGLMGLFYYLTTTGASEITIRTMVFTTLIFSNVLLTLTGRSTQFTVATTIRYKNILVPVAIGITLVLLALSLYFTPVMDVFQFEHPENFQLAICFGVAVMSVLWIDLYKLVSK